MKEVDDLTSEFRVKNNGFWARAMAGTFLAIVAVGLVMEAKPHETLLPVLKKVPGLSMMLK